MGSSVGNNISPILSVSSIENGIAVTFILSDFGLTGALVTLVSSWTATWIGTGNSATSVALIFRAVWLLNGFRSLLVLIYAFLIQ